MVRLVVGTVDWLGDSSVHWIYTPRGMLRYVPRGKARRECERHVDLHDELHEGSHEAREIEMLLLYALRHKSINYSGIHKV